MPLKIRVKPEAKIFAGGAVLKNVGTRPADLLILSDSPVLRESLMMNPERMNDSDAAAIYFPLQLTYLFKGKGQAIDTLVIDTLRNFSKLYPTLTSEVEQMIVHLEAGESFKALKIGHAILEAQGKSAALFTPDTDKQSPAAQEQERA